LHPIRFDEPFGLSVAEAMMCGTPVIAFDRGSMPELIEHAKTGFLVQGVQGAIEAVKNGPALDPYYIRAHAMEKFGIEKMLSEYIEVYEEIIAGRNTSSFF
jgi:glycosyltransferase involved in cell wall biosynthesis